MLTLWDLLIPRKAPKAAPAQAAMVQPSQAPAAKLATDPRPGPSKPTRAPTRPRGGAAVAPRERPRSKSQSMQDRYDRVTQEMLAAYGVRVRKWRTSMSGIAWEVRYRDGSVSRRIESPRPKGPMSAAIFLHEIGHHAIGFNTYKPRCLEEYHAWKFAIEQMQLHNLNVTESVHRRMRRSLEYAVAKARRRGLRQLPDELVPYATPRRDR